MKYTNAIHCLDEILNNFSRNDRVELKRDFIHDRPPLIYMTFSEEAHLQLRCNSLSSLNHSSIVALFRFLISSKRVLSRFDWFLAHFRTFYPSWVKNLPFTTLLISWKNFDHHLSTWFIIPRRFNQLHFSILQALLSIRRLRESMGYEESQRIKRIQWFKESDYGRD